MKQADIELIIEQADIELITAFLKREQADYAALPQSWLQHVLARIQEAAKAPAADLRIQSLGNTGVLLRELRMEPPNYDWKAGVVTVTLCTCGQLECWGSVDRTVVLGGMIFIVPQTGKREVPLPVSGREQAVS